MSQSRTSTLRKKKGMGMLSLWNVLSYISTGLSIQDGVATGSYHWLNARLTCTWFDAQTLLGTYVTTYNRRSPKILWAP